MKYFSIWTKDKRNDKIKKLNKNIEVDVLIIGGGITGLSTLYNLKDTNLKIALVDSNIIGNGITSRSTAKITYLQDLNYSNISKKYNKDVAKRYYESQKDTINKIVNIIKKEKIACSLEKVESFIYTNNEFSINNLKVEKELLTSFGANVKEHENIFLPSKYAISVSDTYEFNPLKYLQALKNICINNNKEIYENTKIIKISKLNDNYLCYTVNNIIKTKKIVLACHYPFFLFPYFMPLKTRIEKSYITASYHQFINKNYLSNKESLRYYKNDNEYAIYANNKSNLSSNLNEKNNYQNSINMAKEMGLRPIYVWKNDDLLTVDKIPYIGCIQKDNYNLLIGTGYNTWGMTNGTLAGLILSNMILNKKNKYQSLCNPLRVNSVINYKEILMNLNYNILGYMKSKINKNKKWYSNKVSFKNINGTLIGEYQDKNKVYKVINKCPHMGCSLIFNEVEKTWDCPCHASRFNLEGKCIKGPSNYDITYKDE